MRLALWLEIGLTALFAGLVLTWGLDSAVAGSLVQATERVGAGEPLRQAEDFLAAAHEARWRWLGGIAALLVGRLLALREPRRDLAVWGLIPAVTLLTGMALLVHFGYGDPLRDRLLVGPGFAQGVLYGGLFAGLLMAIPWDPARLASRWPVLLALALLGSLVALQLFGEAPGGSGAKIRLLGVQPIELVKLGFVVFLAAVLGPRAEQLRYQRLKRGSFQVPRPRLLAGAVVVLVLIFLLLYLVRDLGPVLILSLVFLAFYYAVTRSWPELAVVAAVFVGLVHWVLSRPPELLPATVLTRLSMWRDPWLNGLGGGDQLAASLWAFSAGGWRGRGWGEAAIHAVPTGHTDLVLAHLAEVAGFLGLLGYFAGFALLTVAGLWIAHRNRTPERMALSFGLSMLLLAQLAVIFAGSTGLLPLTGVVVPLLSYGKTSMVVFLVAVALLVRMAATGKRSAERDELRQLGAGIAAVGVVAVAMLAAGVVVAGQRTLPYPETNARGVLVMGKDQSVFFRYDPRIRSIARQIRRGELLDRHGEPLVGTDREGRRTYPLGKALGTLLGPADGSVHLPSWALEGRHDDHLRGLPTSEEELGVWIEIRGDGKIGEPGPGERDRILFAVPTFEPRAEDEERARTLLRSGSRLRFQRLTTRDYGPLLELLRLRGETRRQTIRRVADDLSSRSLRLTLDAALQVTAAEALAEVIPEYEGVAGAAVVLDVDSGEVLVRAQWPDYHPGETDVRAKLLAGDPHFLGSYGPWRDKTGVGGFLQTGSIFKIVSSLAWVRNGLEIRGRGCDIQGRPHFTCARGTSYRPSFSRPHWIRPIHDGHDDADGRLELTEALQVSCNVFFAQLGLELGPEPFAALATDGLEIDGRRSIEAGGPDSRRLASTAFGQGAARMHPLEAARMIAAVGAGGTYRRCPPDLLAGTSCEERRLLDDPGVAEPILAGLRRVVEAGTARRFGEVTGARIYAKTGSATDVGRRDEVPYGIVPGEPAGEHSWFVALAEPDTNDPCEAEAPGRLAVAVAVPRGGEGSGAALDVARRLVDKAAELGYMGPLARAAAAELAAEDSPSP